MNCVINLGLTCKCAITLDELSEDIGSLFKNKSHYYTTEHVQWYNPQARNVLAKMQLL